MAKDVFGREMDLTHKTSVVNKHPLAPSPVDPVTPQNDPTVLFHPGSYTSMEFKRGKGESLGASYKPTATSQKALISAIAPEPKESKWGSYIVSPAISRWERGNGGA
jgi:hypothetical protein